LLIFFLNEKSGAGVKARATWCKQLRFSTRVLENLMMNLIRHFRGFGGLQFDFA
jgi:hypothetical protein